MHTFIRFNKQNIGMCQKQDSGGSDDAAELGIGKFYCCQVVNGFRDIKRKTFSLFCDRIFLPFLNQLTDGRPFSFKYHHHFGIRKKKFFLYNKQRRNKSLKKIAAIKIVFYLSLYIG